MGRIVQEVAVSLVDVNGAALTNMSTGGTAEGYSTAINCFCALEVWFEWWDQAAGNSAPSAALLAAKARADQTAWFENNANYNGIWFTTGVSGNFWKSTAARFKCVALIGGGAAVANPNQLIMVEQVRMHVTVTSANTFTPALRAWVVKDAETNTYPIPS